MGNVRDNDFIMENTKRLDDNCIVLLNQYRQKEKVTDEHIFHFFESMVDLLNGDTNGDCNVDFNHLFLEMEKLLYYENMEYSLESMPSQQAFLYGSIWGAMQLYKFKENRIKQEKNIDELVKKYKNEYRFLSIIQDNPGISNEELQQKCGKDSNELSILISHAYEDRIIGDMCFMKRYYYLRQVGEQVYEKLSENKEFD